MQRTYHIVPGRFIKENGDEYHTASDSLKPLKESLNKSKALQEPFIDDFEWRTKSESYEAVYDIRRRLKRDLRDNDISGAWIKYYELCMNANLLEDLPQKPVIFCNGELPGAGLKAIWHLANTIYKDSFPDSIDWYASSLMPSRQNQALQDSYGLMTFYRDRWLMNDEFNGDMTTIQNQLYWKEKLKEKVDLYFSDAAGPVVDYNEQEREHLPIFIGSVLAGLQTLKPGGRLVVKFYTIFEPMTLSIVAGIASVFDKTFLHKPIGSKRDNSEIYIIGIGYNKRNRFINALKAIIRKEHPIERAIPLLVPSQTLQSIVNAQRDLSEAQSAKLRLNVDSFKSKNESDVLKIVGGDVMCWFRDNPTQLLEKKMITFSSRSQNRR